MSRRLDATARRALAGVRAPEESAAEERAWSTVGAIYAERPAVARARPRRRVALVPVVALVIGAIAFSPAGATVKRIINRALSTPHVSRAPALTLPAPGRLLVSNARGTWVVSSRGTVNSRLRRGLDALKALLAEENPR